MATKKSIYIVDTCSFTTLHKVYDREVLPGVWKKVQDLILTGQIVSVDEVFEEICRQEDGLKDWAVENADIFHPLTEDIQNAAKDIVNRFPKILDFNKNKSGADPFVIGNAVVLSGIVVTEEKPSGGQGKLKIPDICTQIQLPVMNFLSMLKREGLKL
jgi:hypothetical protein